jgi:hypothetical protein
MFISYIKYIKLTRHPSGATPLYAQRGSGGELVSFSPLFLLGLRASVGGLFFTFLLMNRTILLLIQEEYPNPYDSDLHFDISKFMDSGEVVKVITPTTPFPQADSEFHLRSFFSACQGFEISFFLEPENPGCDQWWETPDVGIVSLRGFIEFHPCNSDPVLCSFQLSL